VNLPRAADVEALPAWLGSAEPGEDVWDIVGRRAGSGQAAALEARANLLGLAVSRLGSSSDVAGDAQAVARGVTWPVAPFIVADPPFASRRRNDRRPPGGPLVVDLSSLWAGPLCANLLGLAGARVVKVESTTRPDGARFGPASFFQLLHAGHRSVALPFDEPWGRASLRRLLASADVVVDSSRPRAMEQLAIDTDDIIDAGTIWVSISAYGRSGPWGNRVGFGDDVAVAAGLVAGPPEAPVLCADAAADPVAGLHATVAAVACLLEGGGHLVDVSMREAVASTLATDRLPEVVASPSPAGWVAELGADSVPVALPRSRAAPASAAELGADTTAVLAELTT
jgi:crotonobetainyl-CoA:carnitine CoA-transferase CaiB-like acyl-CoA transferase